MADSYDDDALFKCSEGCGTFQRASCVERYGQVTCPHCKGRGTLRYLDCRAALASKKDAL